MKKFIEGFEHYLVAINNDIKALELIISVLEQHKADFEDAEISKVISFFRGYLSRAKLEKCKAQELSWYIKDEE